MAPRKKSASSASSASTASSTTSSGSSSGSGSESDSSSSGSSSSSVSAKEPKNATKAQNQPQQRRKSQDAKTQKNSDKKLGSSGDEKKHPPSAKKTPNKVQAVGGGKVPPSVMKQMQVPASGPKSVKPSAGVKAAAQQKQNNAKKMSFMKEKKKGASHFTSDTEEEHKPPDMGVAPARKPSNPNQKRRGRPPKNSQPVKAPAVPSSTTDSSSSGGSDSESESSQDSSAAEKGAVKKELNNKSGAKQKKPKAVEVKKTKQAPGKINSESETDTSQRSFSPRSPKRILHRKEIRPVIKVEPIEKRRCPLDECNSLGHLGGLYERHFTIESCPMYHNMSLGDTKTLGAERRKRDEERKKAVETLDRNRKVLTPEQKNYAQKVRDLRAKFKSPPPVAKNDVAKLDYDKEREPNLKGIVPDYDFHLFRQAQSLASENIENELKTLPASKGTKYITMGKNCMQVWYQSPYPEDVARLPKLYLCEFCLRYQKCAIGIKRHAAKCVWRHPPGDEIYRKGKLGVWQIDGKRQKQYCQHLCLLAKFFLDHKTLYYDVEPFLFYVMTVADADGCHTIGYFSKEKNSFLNYNVSCILTLPPYQRKGYGRLLIDFSYLLTRVEGKIGSPEKPLSDLGLISYRSYWKDVLLNYLCTRTGNTLSIKDISQEMAINSYDIVSTLQALGMMKYWKGKHILLKKQDVLEEYVERQERRGNFPKIDPSCLRWVPFVPPQPSSPT